MWADGVVSTTTADGSLRIKRPRRDFPLSPNLNNPKLHEDSDIESGNSNSATRVCFKMVFKIFLNAEPTIMGYTFYANDRKNCVKFWQLFRQKTFGPIRRFHSNFNEVNSGEFLSPCTPDQSFDDLPSILKVNKVDTVEKAWRKDA